MHANALREPLAGPRWRGGEPGEAADPHGAHASDPCASEPRRWVGLGRCLDLLEEI